MIHMPWISGLIGAGFGLDTGLRKANFNTGFVKTSIVTILFTAGFAVAIVPVNGHLSLSVDVLTWFGLLGVLPGMFVFLLIAGTMQAIRGPSVTVARDEFPFNDLSSFRDYVAFAQTYLPDRFRPRDGAGPDAQWNLELAFEGLRAGLPLVAKERGRSFDSERAHAVIVEAYGHYAANRQREGFEALETLRKLLSDEGTDAV